MWLEEFNQIPNGRERVVKVNLGGQECSGFIHGNTICSTVLISKWTDFNINLKVFEKSTKNQSPVLSLPAIEKFFKREFPSKFALWRKKTPRPYFVSDLIHEHTKISAGDEPVAPCRVTLQGSRRYDGIRELFNIHLRLKEFDPFVMGSQTRMPLIEKREEQLLLAQEPWAILEISVINREDYQTSGPLICQEPVLKLPPQNSVKFIQRLRQHSYSEKVTSHKESPVSLLQVSVQFIVKIHLDKLKSISKLNELKNSVKRTVKAEPETPGAVPTLAQKRTRLLALETSNEAKEGELTAKRSKLIKKRAEKETTLDAEITAIIDLEEARSKILAEASAKLNYELDRLEDEKP